jgi:hypothetical protein
VGHLEPTALVLLVALNPVPAAEGPRGVALALQVAVDPIARDAESAVVCEGLQVTADDVPHGRLEAIVLLHLQVAADDGPSYRSAIAVKKLDVIPDARPDAPVIHPSPLHKDATVVICLNVSSDAYPESLEDRASPHEDVVVYAGAAQSALLAARNDHVAIHVHRPDRALAASVIGLSRGRGHQGRDWHKSDEKSFHTPPFWRS